MVVRISPYPLWVDGISVLCQMLSNPDESTNKCVVIWHALWCFKTAVCCDHLKSIFDCCFMFLFRPYCMLCRWCIPVSHCPCVRSLFPLLLHPRPSSLPSTCRRSILTRWSSTSLWVHIPRHPIPSSSPHSPPPPLLRSLALSVPPHNPRKYKIES